MEPIWIIKAAHIKDHQLKLPFSDGTSGIGDLGSHLDKLVFKPLKDIQYFKNFKLNSWTVVWENGADFAPEFLYEAVKKHVTS